MADNALKVVNRLSVHGSVQTLYYSNKPALPASAHYGLWLQDCAAECAW